MKHLLHVVCISCVDKGVWLMADLVVDVTALPVMVGVAQALLCAEECKLSDSSRR